MELKSILAAEGMDLGSTISGVNFDRRRRVQILASFRKLDVMETG